jgi:ankyrin repeat protein
LKTDVSPGSRGWDEPRKTRKQKGSPKARRESNHYFGIQMKSTVLIVLCLHLSFSGNIFAQNRSENPAPGLAVRFAFNKLFGTNACTADSFTKIASDSGRMAIAENFALLDGNVRVETGSSQFTGVGLSQVDAYQYGLDKVQIFRPDLRLCYTIFPQLKAYVVTRGSTNLDAPRELSVVRMEELGDGAVEGHACAKRLAIISDSSGKKQEVLCWLARDLKNFPVRMRFKQGDQVETTTYRSIRFARPDRSLFTPPRDFTLCRDMEELMARLEKQEPSAPMITNTTYYFEESMTVLIKFTLRLGANRPVSSNTANAFKLGNASIPATQIALGSKQDPVVRMFGVSQLDSNDLFFAQINRTTRSGTIWLASPMGKLRGAILTSTNGPPKTVSIENQEEGYNQVRAAFFAVSEPPPWEDAAHPVHSAASFGTVADVEEILKRDEQAINSLDEMGDTPLNRAVVQEHEDIADFLLAHGADPNIPNRNGQTPLEQASSRGKATGLALAKLLLAHGAQVNPTNETEFRIPPLEWAVSSDNLELVNVLLTHGASLKSATTNGDTPLHTAAGRGDLEIAESLLSHGADPNATIIGGTTPLHEAAEGGSVEIAKLLVAHGAGINWTNSSGMTPLLYAAGRGGERTGVECLEFLLSKGATLDSVDERGDSALHIAAYYGNTAVIESLLKHSINVNARNNRGQTALKLAKDPKTAELLRQNGARE